MKDSGNAGFFAKKREREVSSEDDNKSADNLAIPPEVQEILADYIVQMKSPSCFPKIQSFYESLCKDIRKLSRRWDGLQLNVNVAKDREYQRETEVNLEGMVTPAEPMNHLYVRQLALIRQLGALCDDVDAFLESIKVWINVSHERITLIKRYLKNTSPPYVEIMAIDVSGMEQMRLIMARHAKFIQGEMTGLKHVYTNGGTDFQKDIMEKLSKRPELLAWAVPFFNYDEDGSGLQLALNTLKPSRKP